MCAAKYEVKQVILDLMASFPDWKPQNLDNTIAQYEDAFAPYPLDVLEKAAKRCRDSCMFFPKIAEIRKAINEIRGADVPNTESIDWRTIPPRTKEMEEFMAEFRRKMERKGKWNIKRPDSKAVFERGEPTV